MLSERKFNLLYFWTPAILWGLSYQAIAVVMKNDTDVFLGVFIRVFLAFLFLLSWKLIRREKIVWNNRHTWQFMIVGQFAFTLPWWLLFYGEKVVEPALASIINAMVPLVVTLLAPFITKRDTFGLKSLLSVLLSIVGILVIFIPVLKTTDFNFTEIFSDNSNAGQQMFLGMLAIVGMVFCYAISILLNRRLSHKDKPSNCVLYQLAGASVSTGFGWLLFGHQSPITVSLESWLGLVYLSAMSTTIAQILFLTLYTRRTATQVSAITLAMPLIAIVTQIVIMHQGLSVTEATGSFLVLMSLILLQKSSQKVAKSA